MAGVAGQARRHPPGGRHRRLTIIDEYMIFFAKLARAGPPAMAAADSLPRLRNARFAM